MKLAGAFVLWMKPGVSREGGRLFRKERIKMKKVTAIILAVVLACAWMPGLASAIGTGATYTGITTTSAGSTLLSSLSHNCPNTGIMLPESFSPYQTTYLLTVASWVSKPTFTPVAADPSARITVNGQYVASGSKSQVIPLTDKPQAVYIVVSNGAASTTYTIYLQRRPSEKRTRVSSGYINSIYLSGTTWHLDADMVTMHYMGEDYNSGNMSTFTNKAVETGVYDYPVSPNCIFYYGNKEAPYRATNIQQFLSNYAAYGSSLYTFVYIESEIVAVFPYGADY